MTFTMTDMFCGAGGSSTGASWVPGLHVAIAVNHWPVSVATHRANHPETEHLVADISQLAPAAVPATDIGWFSPECTTFSQQAPVRPEHVVARSRSTAHDVIRFAEHRVDRGRPYRYLVCENVTEFATWRFFPTWIGMLSTLGYRHRLVHLNSAAANVGGPSAPQYRDRLYVVCWHKGETEPDFQSWLSPHVTCSACGPSRGEQVYRKDLQQWSYRGVPGVSGGRYRIQYDYRCRGCGRVADLVVDRARDAIDWTDPGPRVRGRGLVDRTLRRVHAGIDKHLKDDPATGSKRAFLMRNNGSPGSGSEHCTSVHEPFRTVTTAGHQCVVTFPGGRGRAHAQANARMRFLKPAESSAAMGFPPDYVLTGTRTEQLKQLGNAVTPPAARDLLWSVCEAMAGRQLGAGSMAA